MLSTRTGRRDAGLSMRHSEMRSELFARAARLPRPLASLGEGPRSGRAGCSPVDQAGALRFSLLSRAGEHVVHLSAPKYSRACRERSEIDRAALSEIIKPATCSCRASAAACVATK